MTRRRSRSYYSDWGSYFPKSTPRPADGIKARSQRGKIGETWWADRWIAVLESIVDSARLQRGRSYARKGQVLEINVTSGQVTARVQGSRATPYEVDIRITPLSDTEWDQVAQAMAEQAIFAAKLLAGEMPQNIEEAFDTARVSLFPRSRKDISTSCSCPDWANPCKHIAAVYYLLGEEFDRDPFLIFRLRGRTKDEIMEALRARRVAEVEAVAEAGVTYTVELEEAPLLVEKGAFWRPGETMEEFPVTIAPPPVEAALLKRLGPPPFWPGAADFLTTLGAAYAAVTARAVALAFGDTEEADDDSG